MAPARRKEGRSRRTTFIIQPLRSFIPIGYIDPSYTGRDALQETIAEAAPLGIAAIPWVEDGFVDGWSGFFPGDGKKGLIFDRHPDWLAKTKVGEDAFPLSVGNYNWMVHTHQDVQSFLIGLTVGLAGNYATSSIQFDRARYPKTGCGYDQYTQELCASEHCGRSIPGESGRYGSGALEGGEAEYFPWGDMAAANVDHKSPTFLLLRISDVPATVSGVGEGTLGRLQTPNCIPVIRISTSVS